MKFDILITDGFWCNECKGYGDDYYFDEDGELVSACETCPIWKKDDEEVQHDNTQK